MKLTLNVKFRSYCFFNCRIKHDQEFVIHCHIQSQNDRRYTYVSNNLDKTGEMVNFCSSPPIGVVKNHSRRPRKNLFTPVVTSYFCGSWKALSARFHSILLYIWIEYWSSNQRLPQHAKTYSMGSKGELIWVINIFTFYTLVVFDLGFDFFVRIMSFQQSVEWQI